MSTGELIFYLIFAAPIIFVIISFYVPPIFFLYKWPKIKEKKEKENILCKNTIIDLNIEKKEIRKEIQLVQAEITNKEKKKNDLNEKYNQYENKKATKYLIKYKEKSSRPIYSKKYIKVSKKLSILRNKQYKNEKITKNLMEDNEQLIWYLGKMIENIDKKKEDRMNFSGALPPF